MTFNFMTIQKQVKTLKENWLLVIGLIIVILVVSGGLNIFSSNFYSNSYDSLSGSIYEKSTSSYYPYPTEDFAPGEENRKITKTTSISTEVKRGNFDSSVSSIKNIISSTDSYLLNINENTYGKGLNSYKQAYIQIKVDTSKYDSIVSQLKEIGEVKSFNENSLDITGRYTYLQTDLENEQKRLQTFKNLLSESTSTEEKISLTDRIFEIERTISYLEESLENLDNRIDYSTIYLTITEKQSNYSNLSLVGISDIVKSFLNSLNSLIKFLFIILPWIIIFLIIKWIYKKFS